MLDELERLASLVDHEADGIGQVKRVALLVPRVVDHLVLGFDLAIVKQKLTGCTLLVWYNTL